ncbi:hypothetical protein NDU88_003835 [Pleurodeles waltl]|uniref:Secreted protein n=1 Tax=Pleurodeles waltl TaxID=8319 RepID=A0AAV7V146_PLEWA|nr:hypothetical protein NDU88_003835 [Pleurodeles waltl]
MMTVSVRVLFVPMGLKIGLPAQGATVRSCSHSRIKAKRFRCGSENEGTAELTRRSAAKKEETSEDFCHGSGDR